METLAVSETFEKLKDAGEQVTADRRVRMFGRNTVASTLAFALDLLILWSLVQLLEVARIPAAVVAFIVPMIMFYILSREWVFPHSGRGVASGFVYFMLNIGIGFVAMLAVYAALLQLTGIHYLIARVTGSIVSGIVIFLLNGIFNFKRL